ncbi:lysozyme inhibitor LprI family protein [Roseixanthobacter glucoisosaccharinicivorans]|uniref:lysozyme inhibitor LprI family protein n=1 Tax=Roseixanthobacter glucoisosaccharinicivorans TaxID=3119923 RepID=UPI0037267BF3
MGKRLVSRFSAGALVLLAAASTLCLPAGARAASFDCAAAQAPDEKAICVTLSLNDLDVKMATEYAIVTRLVGMGQRGDLQDQQRAFLKQRAACGSDVACIAKAYRDRIAVFEGVVDGVVARGPF